MENSPRTSKERVVFYMTKEDKEALIKKCKSLCVQTSFFIRNLVLENLGKPIFNAIKVPFELRQYMNELMSQGNNLNQIAKKLNQGEKISILNQQEVLDSMQTINRQIVELKNAINKLMSLTN